MIKAKYILNLFSFINVFSFSLVEAHIPNKRQDGSFFKKLNLSKYPVFIFRVNIEFSC